MSCKGVHTTWQCLDWADGLLIKMLIYWLLSRRRIEDSRHSLAVDGTVPAEMKDISLVYLWRCNFTSFGYIV